jgi:hypothetical protein
MFIHIGPFEVLFLLALGFFGGMLSGFIGSGGAFVLTPGMMSIGTPGPIAVASNMCHKFPKAMIGAYRRYKLRQLDPKLALIMAVSAIFGVQVGIQVQARILEMLGPTGTNLYVSMAFLIVLPTVAAILIRDVVRAKRLEVGDVESKLPAKLERKFRLPPMIRFEIAGRTHSIWLTIPLGFGTGFLAATIAVGGFIGVPSMIYLIGASSAVASGTELGIAFVMGSTGTFTWIYLLGAVDLRLTTLILATSLIGVQIGAVGTTYVRQYYIKMAMATVMLLVTLSRALAVPGYLVELGWIEMDESVLSLLNAFVLPVMAVAFLSSTPIVLYPMLSIRKKLAEAGLLDKSLDGVHVGRFAWKRIGVFGFLTSLNYYILFHDPEWWPRFVTSIPHTDPVTAAILSIGVILFALYWSFVHGSFAYGLLDFVKIAPLKKEISAIVAEHGKSGLEEWIDMMSDKFEKGKWPIW